MLLRHSQQRSFMGSHPHVTFSWCDRENRYQKKTKTISGTELLKRFPDHIVPPYFRRIRHLGFLASRSKKQNLKAIRQSLGLEQLPPAPLSRAQVLELRFGQHSLLRCKDCGGVLQLMESWPGQRAPPVNALTGMCQ